MEHGEEIPDKHLSHLELKEQHSTICIENLDSDSAGGMNSPQSQLLLPASFGDACSDTEGTGFGTSASRNAEGIDKCEQDILTNAVNNACENALSAEDATAEQSQQQKDDAKQLEPEQLTKALQEKYSKVAVLIEGPELGCDHSYYLVDQCEDLRDVEKGIPASHFLKLDLNQKGPGASTDSASTVATDLANDSPEPLGYDQLIVRDLEMEYRVLMRINCHKAQYNNLFKSSSQEFRRRNKYNEILPYQHNMVRINEEISEILNQKQDEGETRSGLIDRFSYYYNASFINSSIVGERGNKTFIAAMAPTSTTVDSFWRLLCQNKVGLIIQLCPEEESGKEMCCNYYEPHQAKEAAEGEQGVPQFSFGGTKLQLVGKECINEGLILRRIQVVSHDNPVKASDEPENQLVVRHIQECKWPDNKPPGTRSDCGPQEAYARIIYILDQIEAHRAENPQGSVLVHCSAGVGRTGTLIAIYTLVESLKFQLAQLAEPQISVFGVVRRLREQRWNMVRNHAQYRYIYQFVKDWLQERQSQLSPSE